MRPGGLGRTSSGTRREPGRGRGARQVERGDRRAAGLADNPGFRRSSFTRSAILGSTSITGVTSRSTSRAPGFLGAPTGRGSPRLHRRTSTSSCATSRALESVMGSGAWTEPEPDRVLATVLFTDIVGSTARRPSSATGRGECCWSDTTRACGDSSRATGGARSTRPGTASSRASTARPGRSAVRPPYATPRGDRPRGARRAAHGRWRAGGREGGRDRRRYRRPRRRAGGARRGLVSSTVKELVVGSGIEFEDRGTAELKGGPASGGSTRSSPLRRRTRLAESAQEG